MLRSAFAVEVDLHAVQHRAKRHRLNHARQSFDNRLGHQIFACDVAERLGGERRASCTGRKLRAFERNAKQVLLQLVVVLEVDLFPALLRLVERRLRDVDVAALDEFRHLPIEEGKQQCTNVRSVDVGVGHDDDAVIAKLRDIERILVVLVDTGLAKARAKRRDQRNDLLRADQLVEARTLDVKDLAAQRQDRLELAVAALLGGASRGIAFDQIQLTERRVALLAVGELAG